jgi:hypothetical protein
VPVVTGLDTSRHPLPAPSDLLRGCHASHLQTLLEIGSANATTIVFPVPIELIKPFLERADP